MAKYKGLSVNEIRTREQLTMVRAAVIAMFGTGDGGATQMLNEAINKFPKDNPGDADAIVPPEADDEGTNPINRGDMKAAWINPNAGNVPATGSSVQQHADADKPKDESRATPETSESTKKNPAMDAPEHKHSPVPSASPGGA